MTSLQISYFLSVAKYMSFTKAAAELYITQPSLSKQISNLENELGVRLFDRSNKAKLRLTAAGTTLNDFFSRISEEYRLVLQQAQDEDSPFSGTLRIGVIEGLDFIAKIRPVIERWASEYPKVQFQFERQPLEKLNQSLLSGDYDVIIQLDILANHTPGIYREIINDEYGVFLFSSENPLAGKPDLSPMDFRSDPFYVLDDGDDHDIMREADIRFCEQSHGFTPILVPMPNGDSILHAISAGRGFGLFHPWSWYKNSPDFRWIKTTQRIPLCIARKESNRRRLTHLFCADVLSYFKSTSV